MYNHPKPHQGLMTPKKMLSSGKQRLRSRLEILEKRNFGPLWISWIKQITHMGSVGVKINGIEGHSFITWKGLRQGDPLSPLLFNLVVDVLSRMLFKAASQDMISGLCSNLIPDGVICLQYADDTILFVDNSVDKVTNLKHVLTCFRMYLV